MNTKKLLALYGLKWNPFLPDLPAEGLLVSAAIEDFAWRVENLVHDGGFALITGEVGTGKSVALRILFQRLSALPELAVGVLTRPQSQTGDFYRELGEIFGVQLKPSNRWGGFKALRERWKSHVESSLLKPVLLIDEAQEMAAEVLSELRLLASAHFDSTSYLTTVLCGDGRLVELFRHADLVPLGSRIRTRLVLEYASREQLREMLLHVMTKAGNRKLMTTQLVDTLVEHSAGNYRVLMTMAGELLMAAAGREAAEIDEKLYFEVFQSQSKRREGRAAAKVGRR